MHEFQQLHDREILNRKVLLGLKKNQFGKISLEKSDQLNVWGVHCWNATQKWLAVTAWILSRCFTPQLTWSYGLVNSLTQIALLIWRFPLPSWKTWENEDCMC